MTRRDLFKAGGAIIVSLTLGDSLFAQTGKDSDLGKSLDVKGLDSFLALHADGTVTIYTSKVDVGVGLRIAVCQMAADELGVALDKVTVVEGDTALTPDHGGTGGSTGITRGGVDIRQAAATARQALLAMASAQLGVSGSDLDIADGRVAPRSGSGQIIPIEKLMGGRHFGLQLDPKAPLRNFREYQFVGHSEPRPDVVTKCTGRHVYVQDFHLPDMLHARVIRPASMGATLESYDEASIKAIPGVRVVRQNNFVAVVSQDEWAVVRAARELKVKWSEWNGLPGSDALEAWVRKAEIDRSQDIVKKGDVGPILNSAPKKLSASYYWPCQSHASMGPSCSVADVKDGTVTVWSSTQSTHGLRAAIAKAFGMEVTKVRVIYMDGSGSYGTNGTMDAAADAVLLSKTLGKPVRVQWSRQDELGWDPKGPQQVLDLRAGINNEGQILAWDAEMWAPTTIAGANPITTFDLAGLPQDHGMGAGLLTQNVDPPYAAANMHVVAHLIKTTPLRPSNLRAPGKIGNVFASEGFADELAAAVKMDPVEWRLRGLNNATPKDPRAIEVVMRAAKNFGWKSRPAPNAAAPNTGLATGQGFAYMRYKNAENYVALAMEVTVDRATGAIQVRRVTCVHDCGLIINPDALQNQIEGNIVQTIGRTLHEETRFDQSHVTSVDWNSYPLLRFPESPAISVEMVNHPDLPPMGAGEAASAPVAAAIANAFFDATGVRLRRAPFTRERVKAALA